MPYRFLTDIALADAAFEAWGESPGEMFAAAAEATIAVMVSDPEAIAPLRTIEIELLQPEMDLLLFSFINELIFYKDAERLLLRVPAVKITAVEEGFRLSALGYGETANPARHNFIVDVKAATMHRLSVRESGGRWEATMVLDV
jgi:SHS2 domain-containing protein